MRDSVETRARILKTAEKILSEKGFDGARVDDIAKEAGVNKALIYYYFKSKNEILETILSNLFQEAKNLLVQSAGNTSDISSEGGYRKLFDAYINFVTRNRKIIKIAIAESAKDDAKPSIVMELGKIIINSEIENIRREYSAKGIHYPDDKQELLVLEFFTGLVPFLAYALYKEQWESLYNVSEEELREAFYRVYTRTHLAAHLP